MMQIIQKWQITLEFHDDGENLSFFIYDNFYSNMLRKLTEFCFTVNPDVIKIEKVKELNDHSKTTTNNL